MKPISPRLAGRTLAAILLTAAIGCASAAERTAFSTLEISGLRYELIDLDPNDGITPAIQISREYTDSSSYYNNFPDLYFDDRRDTYGSTFVSMPEGSAGTEFAPGRSKNVTRIATASSDGLTLGASTAYSIDFRLTPSTGLFFYATATVTSTQSGPWAYTANSIQMEGTCYESGPQSTSFRDTVGLGNESGTYHLSGYLHSGNTAAEGDFWFNTNTISALGAIPAVPEPGTYAMLLAGLMVVGAGARSRRAAARRTV